MYWKLLSILWRKLEFKSKSYSWGNRFQETHDTCWTTQPLDHFHTMIRSVTLPSLTTSWYTCWTCCRGCSWDSRRGSWAPCWAAGSPLPSASRCSSEDQAREALNSETFVSTAALSNPIIYSTLIYYLGHVLLRTNGKIKWNKKVAICNALRARNKEKVK